MNPGDPFSRRSGNKNRQISNLGLGFFGMVCFWFGGCTKMIRILGGHFSISVSWGFWSIAQERMANLQWVAFCEKCRNHQSRVGFADLLISNLFFGLPCFQLGHPPPFLFGLHNLKTHLFTSEHFKCHHNKPLSCSHRCDIHIYI